MDVSRRLANWRLVAMLVAVCALAATSALAQGQRVRIKIGPTNVYEHPRPGSDVITTLPEGTVLEALKREGGWYWVVLPRDANGVRRAGYVPVYAVDALSPQGAVQPDTAARQTSGRVPAPLGPRVAPAASMPRYFVAIGGGGQSTSPAFADAVVGPLYDETARYDNFYSTRNASALDISVGLHLSPSFVLAVAWWHSTSLPNADVAAVVPHPFTYDAPRLATASAATGRAENDGHLQLTWLVPLAPSVDLSIFGGPSLFYVRQDLIAAPSSSSFGETYPYETVRIASLPTVRVAKAGFGANVGADVTVIVWRNIGVGATGRYARGKVQLPSAGSGTIDMKVGGAQVSGGVRLRF